VTVQLTAITAPFIALKTGRGEETSYTICEVTKRGDEVVELLVRNGHYPADLAAGENELLLTVSPRGGDERYAGYEPWAFQLAWQGDFPKSVEDLAGMQAHVAREVAAGRGSAPVVEAEEAAPAPAM